MPRTDFNGDGRDDVIFRNPQSGQIMSWLGQPNGAFAYNTWAGVEWSKGTLLAIGDWNADGQSDTLWRWSNDEIYMALTGNGGAFYLYEMLGYVATLSMDWHVAGAGDFNGDGRDDVLWQNSAGAVVTWQPGGNYDFIPHATYQLPAGWIVIGTGDFNGDGRDDALLRNNDGTITNWLGQNDGGFLSNHANAVYNLPNDWHLAGIGDFNGDNRDDVLLRNNDGVITQWLGTTSGAFVSNHALATYALPLTWNVNAVGDYNGDGFDDLLFRNEAGTITNWLGGPNGQFVSNHAVAAYTLSHDWEALSNPLSGAVWDYF